MRNVIFVLLSAVICCSQAQQRAHFSQYMNNYYLLNPAVSGLDDVFDVKLGYRTQWVGMADHPETYYLTGHTPVFKDVGYDRGVHGALRGQHTSWHNVGGNVYRDVTGPSSRSGAALSYAYNMKLKRHLHASFGASVGVQQYSIDFTKLNPGEADREIDGQPSINDMVPDMSLGIWVYDEYFFAGASMYQLLQNGLGVTETGKSKLNNHYFITGGFNWPVSERVALVPSFMLKIVTPAPPSVDVNCKVRIDEKYWLGASYRALDAFVVMAGLSHNNLDFGYSFDMTTSELNRYNTGTHEIIIGYRFPLTPGLICPSRFW